MIPVRSLTQLSRNAQSGWSASARSRNVVAIFAAIRPTALGMERPGLASKLDSFHDIFLVAAPVLLVMGTSYCVMS